MLSGAKKITIKIRTSKGCLTIPCKLKHTENNKMLRHVPSLWFDVVMIEGEKGKEKEKENEENEGQQEVEKKEE